MLKRTPLMMITILLASCMAAAPRPTPASSAKPVQEQVSLAEMDTGFLYLATEDALQNHRPVLAIRFLGVLVGKDQSAILPRIQLAELLLRTGHIKKAQKQVNLLLNAHALSPDNMEKIHLLQAQILTVNGNLSDAIQVLKQALKANPEILTARMMLIRLMEKENRFDEAHQVIHAGIKNSLSIQLYHIDAELYIRQGNFTKAKQTLENLRTSVPDQPGPVLMLSRLDLRQGNTIEAEVLLRKFLAGHPRALSISNVLGRLLIQQKRNKEAIAIYENVSQKMGGNPEVLTALGLLYYQQKDYPHAVVRFRQALTSRDTNQTRFYLATSLEAMGKKDAAKKLYQTIQHHTASYTDAQLRLAVMDLQAARTDAALSRLRTVIRENPEAERAYALLSSALLQKKKYQQLLTETESALALPKVAVQLLFNRAAAFEALKQYNAATDQIKKLFIIEPDNIEALNFLGYLYAEQGVHLGEAEKLIRRALKQKPDNGYYLDSLAWVNYKRGTYTEALSFQRRAVKKIPDDPTMLEHLGDILWKAGKVNEARTTWKKSLRLGYGHQKVIQKKIRIGL